MEHTIAWSTPPTITALTAVATSWANTIRDLLRYLKGMDGAVTIDAAMTIQGALNNGTIATQTFTLANGTTQVLCSTAVSATIIVHAQNTAAVGIFQLQGSGAATAEVYDYAGNFSVTAGTGSSFNIYHSGGNYILQNNIGGSRTFGILLIGTT